MKTEDIKKFIHPGADMTKLDVIATEILKGILSSDPEVFYSTNPEAMAKRAIKFAKALVTELQKEYEKMLEA